MTPTAVGSAQAGPPTRGTKALVQIRPVESRRPCTVYTLRPGTCGCLPTWRRTSTRAVAGVRAARRGARRRCTEPLSPSRGYGRALCERDSRAAAERSLLHPGGVQWRAAGPRARSAAVRDRRAGAFTCTGGQLRTGRATPSLFVPRRAYRFLDAARMLAFHLLTVWRLDISAKKAYVSERLARLLLQRRKRAAARRGAPSPDLIRQQGFGEALAAYHPEQYPGRVVLFRGAGLPWGLARTNDFGWGRWPQTWRSSNFQHTSAPPCSNQQCGYWPRGWSMPSLPRPQ